jgi:hypothetical protein
MEGEADARTLALLQKLEQAAQPLGKGALFGRKPGKADVERLNGLLKAGTVVNLAGRGGFSLVTAADAKGRFAPLPIARQALLDHLGSSLRPLSLSEAGLAAVKVPAYARSKRREAAAQLVAEGRLIPLKIGRSNLVIATAGVQRYLEQKNPPPPIPSPPPFEDQLRAVYEATLLPGHSMVELGELQRRLGWSLEVLHTQLRRLRDEQRIRLIVGEPTLLSPEDRAAGLPLDARTYYFVEFV